MLYHSIAYNNVNLPVRYEFMDGSLLENTYDVDGNLLQRRHRVPAGAGGNVTSTAGAISAPVDDEGYHTMTIDYSGAWEFTDGCLSRTNIPGGYIVGDSIYFNIADHQGNIRQVWNATTGQTVQDNHYYPYGGLFGKSSSTEFVKAMATQSGGSTAPEISTNPYRYCGKEWLTCRGLNLYDFAARQYDPTLGRFLYPLNGDYPHLSPYLYCAANPINLSDPTGLKWNFDELSEDDLAKFMEQVDLWKENLPELSLLYDLIEESETEFFVRFDDGIATSLSASAEGNAQTVSICLTKFKGNWHLLIDKNSNFTYFNFAEDLFHCYQQCNLSEYLDQNNFEYEAKLFANIVLKGNGFGGAVDYPYFKSVLSLLGWKDTEIGYTPEFKDMLNSDLFLNKYQSGTMDFVQFNKSNGIGNGFYRSRSDAPPLNLLKFYNLFQIHEDNLRK